MNNFSAVIFDLDGLLLDTERLYLETFNETCSYFGLEDLSHIFIQCIGANYELGSSILKNGLDGRIDFDRFTSHWDQLYKKLKSDKPIPLKDGAKSLLQKIVDIKLPMAVATSSSTKNANEKLEKSGIYKYFSAVIGGDQVSQSKPAPEIYLKAAFSLSVAPSNCLALEDSPNGVRAAVAASMTVIQIPDLIKPDEELLKLGHIVLKSLKDVNDYKFAS